MSTENAEKGEGNRKADKEYRERTKEFVQKADVESKAKEAKKQDAREGAEAEAVGRSKAKEVDPEVKRNYHSPA